jgi:hypothetical protein
MCKVAGNVEFPPQPKCIAQSAQLKTLFQGFFRRMVLRAIARKDVRFITSLYYSKRVWPLLTDQRDKESLDEHLMLLTKRAILEPCEKMVEMLNLTGREIFSLPRLQLPTKMLPSSHACLQASLKKGGAFSLFPKLGCPEKQENVPSLPWRGQSYLSALNKWRQFTYQRAQLEISKKDWNDLLKVKVQLVKEPGKNRTITLGDGHLYTAVQPAQGQMLDAWARTPYSTMREDVDSKVQRLLDNSPSDWLWGSVDYKSATDTIFTWATKSALKGGENLADYALLLQSVEEGNITYPKKDKKSETVWLRQTSGQLMGSPLSFPLLCVINLSVYRRAVERWYVDHKDRRDWALILWKNVIINGDDLLFRAPPGFNIYFYEEAAKVGFIPSVGKNFLSRSFAQINSRAYKLEMHTGKRRMVRMGYMNLVLLQGKVLHQDVVPSFTNSMCESLLEMTRLCQWSRSCLSACLDRWNLLFYKEVYVFRPYWYLSHRMREYHLANDLCP